METTEKIFLETIEKYHMLEQGGRVVAAVSGGADSICLLALLWRFRERLGIKVRAVHVHHGLRGAEADRDADFVKAYGERLGVPVDICCAKVKEYARQQKLSQEEAGRILRYQILQKAAKDWEAGEPGLPVKIAVAHHGDDQAETIFHNFCRGSGLAGLGGMKPVRGRIIRPLLGLRRREIHGWLEAQGIECCLDSTNLETDYTRNRIRNQVFPMIESQVNPNARENMIRLGRIAAQADAYFRKQAEGWLQIQGITEGLQPKAPVMILTDLFLAQEEILQSYILHVLLARMEGQAKDLTQEHVASVRELFFKPPGRKIQLPKGLEAVKTYEGVRLEYADETGDPAGREAVPPQLEITVFPWKKGMEIPKNQYTKWFDCGKIKGMPVVRTRQSGDYMTLPQGGRKLLRRLMIDDKIPREKRDRLWLLADGSHIMWIIGYRISEYYKIGADTVQVLQARLTGALAEEDTREEGNNGG